MFRDTGTMMRGGTRYKKGSQTLNEKKKHKTQKRMTNKKVSVTHTEHNNKFWFCFLEPQSTSSLFWSFRIVTSMAKVSALPEL